MSKQATPSQANDWAKVQPRLKQLYCGPDPMFVQSTLCANCSHTAINAGDCNKCHKLICGVCLAKDSTCKNCKEPTANVGKMHPVEQALFDRAAFGCLYDACKARSIPHKDLEAHLFRECKFRIIDCPNGCGAPPFEVSQEVNHRKTCAKEQVTCAACKKAKVPRSGLKAHLETDCTNSTLVCPKCNGSYKASEEHCCISFLRSLIDRQAADAADSRTQTNEIFENFNSHVQRSLLMLEQRCNEQQKDTQNMLEAIIGLNS